MDTMLDLGGTSALNLTLEGSIGSFRVSGVGEGAPRSTQVRFLETHIGFDPAVAANETMLRHLEPVRETFDFRSLDFDQIMQRDIDDARVSTELIPYLLDAGAGGTIKFFPPVVIVVVPMQEQSAAPSRYYPKVESGIIPGPKTSTQRIRSGDVGSEAFEFEYPILNGRPLLHDLARLKLNTNKVRLVIIDGQHRAMALLALYRNIKDEWTNVRRTPFKDYYTEWTKQRISKFNLSEMQLPVIVCTFPELDTAYTGPLDIIKAARSTFLTLNKTARKVSESRNILLNDRDLISHFLRDALGEIKARDVNAPSSLRIWNVELDQTKDRVKIESPMASTGVSHVYYAIEHLMLNEGNVKGLSSRTGRFDLRTFLEPNLLLRLDGENLLGAAEASSIRRDDYSETAATKLSTAFRTGYGKYLLQALEGFLPFELHNNAAGQIEVSLLGNPNPQIRTILFEGQNIGRTFQDYLSHMEGREKAARRGNVVLPPEVQSTLQHLRGIRDAVESTRQRFLAARADQFFSGFNDKPRIRDVAGTTWSSKVRKPIDELFDRVFLSVAFQAALVCGYFLVMEKAEARARERGITIASRDESFKQYLACLNTFFVPNTFVRLRNLIKTFFHNVDGNNAAEWTIVPSATTFNAVVFRGEMKPDEWPKYRYLLLELWAPADSIIEEVRIEERNFCREQAFRSLRTKKVKDLCVELQKNEKDLVEGEWALAFERTFEDFDGFLRNLDLTQSQRMSKAAAAAALEGMEAEGGDDDVAVGNPTDPA